MPVRDRNGVGTERMGMDEGKDIASFDGRIDANIHWAPDKYKISGDSEAC